MSQNGEENEAIQGENGEQVQNDSENISGEEGQEEPQSGQQSGEEEGEYQGSEGGEYEEGEEGEYEEGEGEEISGEEHEYEGEEEEHHEESKEISNQENVKNDSRDVLELENSNEEEKKDHESEGEVEDDESLGDDTGLNLPPEREVRYKMFKFINKMRINCHLHPYTIDLIGNNIAMEYAQFLLNNKESMDEFNGLAKGFGLSGQYKVSTLDSFIDADKTSTQNSRYNDFSTEFYDVQATLIEFEQHCENILSEELNKVGIGMAFNDSKVVVVNVFTHNDVIAEGCSVNPNDNTIVVKGKMANPEFGAYALRVVKKDAPNKTIIQITPQYIIPSVGENKARAFTATFHNAAAAFEDQENNFLEIYVRVKPELIPYNRAFTDKIRFEDLKIGARIPLVNFPIERQLKEEHRQDLLEEEQERKNQAALAEIEKNKLEEKKRRMANDAYAYGKDTDEMEQIIEDPNEEGNLSDKDDSSVKGKGKSDSKGDQKSKMSDSIDRDLSRVEKSENFEKELNDLESTIEKLKENNEKIQKKIKVIYEFRKKEGREERNFYKESNINESTYADSLSSTAALYNDLNTHKTKLDQDLKRYRQSIEEQESKKEEVYRILMDYKKELLASAETRKGGKIPQAQIDQWLDRERDLEEEIKDLRIQSFTKTLEMNRLKKELKKMEDYFEGLHIIDFEQLKIENNTLTEKIEDRNEEIHKLKNKINYTVQILAHLQEKSQDIYQEKEMKKGENEALKKKIIDMKMKLTNKKEENDKKALKQLNENKKIDQINSVPLKNYYKNTLQHIAYLGAKIEEVSKELTVYRQKRKARTKDITELLQRKDRMMKDFKTLPKIEDDDK